MMYANRFNWCADVSLVFFFKQKTAYEMRISDWSSDVCSSDLAVDHQCADDDRHCRAAGNPERQRRHEGGLRRRVVGGLRCRDAFDRSEEHTSELQSLMRISYAVFCLQKKIKHTQTTHYSTAHTIPPQTHIKIRLYRITN